MARNAATRQSVCIGLRKQHAEVYKRWWTSRKGSGHVHLMLLWLQRDYVFKKFEGEPALAGMDEETPYDFDHILPSAHWVCGTGNHGPNTFMAFPLKEAGGTLVDKTGHWYIGNGLGNIHVLDSSDNRSLGDTSVGGKLENSELAGNTQILETQIADWRAVTGSEESPSHWDKVRALAFQTAVEKRAFALYEKFYADLQCES